MRIKQKAFYAIDARSQLARPIEERIVQEFSNGAPTVTITVEEFEIMQDHAADVARILTCIQTDSENFFCLEEDTK